MNNMSLTDPELEQLPKKPFTSLETMRFLTEAINSEWFHAVKLGSEVEGNTLEELAFVRSVFPLVPLRFKIGGCGAKNDIRAAHECGVDYLVLPMAETVYALENFIEICQEYRGKYVKAPLASLNVETVTMVRNLPEFLPYLEAHFTSITIGRSDLSASLRTDVNSQEVLDNIETILSFVNKNLPHVSLSIGGKITPLSGKMLCRNFMNRVSFMNTKFAYINPAEDIEERISEALIFEIMLYYLLYIEGFRTKEEFTEFSVNNRKRIER